MRVKENVEIGLAHDKIYIPTRNTTGELLIWIAYMNLNQENQTKPNSLTFLFG